MTSFPVCKKMSLSRKQCMVEIKLQSNINNFKNLVLKKAVNGVSHSQKTANIFLIRSRMTEAGLNVGLRGITMHFFTVYKAQHSLHGMNIDGCLFHRQLFNWHPN